MKSVALLVSLILLFPGCSDNPLRINDYNIDTTFSCSLEVNEVKYSTTMRGSRRTKEACKGLGDCWGAETTYEPELLTNPVSCQHYSVEEGRKTWESSGHLSCTFEGKEINVDPVEKTGILIMDGDSKPMDCFGSSIYRDEHG